MMCMKKGILAVVCVALFSCGNQNTDSTGTTPDSTTNAAANDSAPHPNGMTNDAVISTDTAAMKPLVDTQHR